MRWIMYKRWMTSFLILIFIPIHLSIADKVMRTNSLALSIIFTLVELAIFFLCGKKVWPISHSKNLPKRYSEMASILHLALPVLYICQFFWTYSIRYNSSGEKFITFIACALSRSLYFGPRYGRNVYARDVTRDGI